MTLHVQFLTMTSMIAGGFYLGVMLDTFRRLTIYWKESRFLTYFMEIGFWLTQTFVLFYILFRVNAGELRLYIFIASLLGFSIYKVMAASIYTRILERAIQAIQLIYYYTKKTILLFIVIPIQWIITLLITIIMLILHSLIAVLLLIIRIVLFPIKWISKLIYSLLPSILQKNLYKLAAFCSILITTCIKWLKQMTCKRG